jgi:hypothetical protein
MKYTVDYTHYPEWQAKIEAMKDTQDWLGKARFRKVVKLLKGDNQSSLRMLYFALALVGVQGYPAQVMIELYVPKQMSFVFE